MAKTAQIKTDRRKPVSRKTATANVSIGTSPTTSVSDDVIAARAFEYYCSRGGEHGRDMDDWLAAERELRGSMGA
ncbi:MAG: DUF2934 domain-containing protein [Vicinamibacterales bacterium]